MKSLKKKMCQILCFVVFAVAASSCEGTNELTKVTNLKCEYQEEPIGLDVKAPRFTWNFSKGEDDFQQKAFIINVATSPDLLLKGEADVWTSRKIESTRPFVQSAGDYKSHTTYYWNVTVWDQSNNKCEPSAIASFTMAKMLPSDWKAVWITDGNDKDFRPSPLFRKDFELKKEIRSAKVYVSGLGYYELFLNGHRIGKNYLDPGYTQFDKRVLYVTHDVTKELQKDKNVLAAVVGNGWFNVQAKAVWDFEKAHWRNRPQFLCELRVEYSDGSIETVATDESWKTNVGGYQYNNIYSGDIYDARKEEKGWKYADFDDSSWKPVQLVPKSAALLQAQQMPAMHITKQITPVAMKQFNNKLYVFDLGENIAGFCRLQVDGKAGTVIKIRHGELLKDDGRLEQGNISVYFHPEDKNEVFQEDVFILNGEGKEVFNPSFVYHGFQYVEVESSEPILLKKEDLTGLFVHTDVEPVGSFQCSNETLNKIWKATCQSYLSNIHSIPTDCPQREKNGWTADAHISVDLGLLNFDGILFYEKWMRDFIDNQQDAGNISGIIPTASWGYADWIGPVWDAALFVIPHALYMYYGDDHCIEALYLTCQKYLEYLKTKEDKDGLVTYGIGDWLPYNAKTPTDYTSSCFYYFDYVRMSEFSALLGKDNHSYLEKAERIKQLINKKYFDAEKDSYANGTQTALGVALYLGIVPQEKEQAVADNLAKMVKTNNCFLDFGVLGSKTVPAMLTKYGYVDLAYAMASKEIAPSWGYWVNEKRMTTLGETWIMSPQFNDASLNHVFMGDIIAWMQNSLAGINYDPKNPGFSHVLITPHFIKELNFVKGEYQSVKGLIRSEWKRKDGKITLTVVIPAGVTATVQLDKSNKVGSGTHIFVIE